MLVSKPAVNANSQWRGLLVAAGFVWLPATLLLLVIALFCRGNSISVGHFTRDPATETSNAFYLGLISYTGILFWTTAATVCLFSHLMLSRYGSDRELSRFLLCFGLLTAMLGLDDLFLLHEQVFPIYLGIHERVIFAVYGLWSLYGLVRFREVILRTNYLVLLAAFVLLATSLLFDAMPLSQSKNIKYLMEDGPKFLGIGTWMIYLLRVATHGVKQEFEKRQGPGTRRSAAARPINGESSIAGQLRRPAPTGRRLHAVHVDDEWRE